MCSICVDYRGQNSELMMSQKLITERLYRLWWRSATETCPLMTLQCEVHAGSLVQACPHLSQRLSSSCWKETSCVLVETVVLDEWVDCRGVSKVPCLRATVNLTGSDSAALLHYDEEPVLHGSEVGI